MKVVLFCGGYGMRMRNGADGEARSRCRSSVPGRCIWHVMRYYAHFGHTEFILCLGYGAQHIKEFFLNYKETASNDFVLRAAQVELLSHRHQRLVDHLRPHRRRHRRSASGYAGSATIWTARRCSWPTTPTCSPTRRCGDHRPLRDRRRGGVDDGRAAAGTFHCIDIDEDGEVEGHHAGHPDADLGQRRILRAPSGNFRSHPGGRGPGGDGCVELAKRGRLMAYRHRGYWRPTDTVKERIELDEAYSRGDRPWALWERHDRG